MIVLAVKLVGRLSMVRRRRKRNSIELRTIMLMLVIVIVSLPAERLKFKSLLLAPLRSESPP